MGETDDVRAVVDQQVGSAVEQREGEIARGVECGGARREHVEALVAERLRHGVVGLVGVSVDVDHCSGVAQEEGEHGGLRLEHHRQGDPQPVETGAVAELGERGGDRHEAAGPGDACAGVGDGTVAGDVARVGRRHLGRGRGSGVGERHDEDVGHLVERQHAGAGGVSLAQVGEVESGFAGSCVHSDQGDARLARSDFADRARRMACARAPEVVDALAGPRLTTAETAQDAAESLGVVTVARHGEPPPGHREIRRAGESSNRLDRAHTSSLAGAAISMVGWFPIA